MAGTINVAFIGNPNCGKTTLFNAYTGANLTVANWPGVTVEKKEGHATYQGQDFRLIDLPGIYSLTSYTMEETVSRECILSDEVDIIVDVVDASCLERNLYLTLQLIELGKPVVLALNMMDIVEERAWRSTCTASRRCWASRPSPCPPGKRPACPSCCTQWRTQGPRFPEPLHPPSPQGALLPPARPPSGVRHGVPGRYRGQDRPGDGADPQPLSGHPQQAVGMPSSIWRGTRTSTRSTLLICPASWTGITRRRSSTKSMTLSRRSLRRCLSTSRRTRPARTTSTGISPGNGWGFPSFSPAWPSSSSSHSRWEIS